MAVAICAALDRFTGAGKSKVDWIHISRDAEAIVIMFLPELRITILRPSAALLRSSSRPAASIALNYV